MQDVVESCRVEGRVVPSVLLLYALLGLYFQDVTLLEVHFLHQSLHLCLSFLENSSVHLIGRLLCMGVCIVCIFPLSH